MTAFVAHLDADAFYVNAERVRHPDLAGKPVGVSGNQGACVIAKSYDRSYAVDGFCTPFRSGKTRNAKEPA